jgi:hypothetical protein
MINDRRSHELMLLKEACSTDAMTTVPLVRTGGNREQT